VNPPAGKTPAGDEPADDIGYANRGLARERTELAWTRTAIAFAAVGAAILRYRPVVGLPVLALSAVVWRLGRPPGPARAGHARDRRPLLITVTTVGVSLAALALSFLGPGIGPLH
jgi:uncharacterized membrane protein YidH (DUF202 family)